MPRKRKVVDSAATDPAQATSSTPQKSKPDDGPGDSGDGDHTGSEVYQATPYYNRRVNAQKTKPRWQITSFSADDTKQHKIHHSRLFGRFFTLESTTPATRSKSDGSVWRTFPSYFQNDNPPASTDADAWKRFQHLTYDAQERSNWKSLIDRKFKMRRRKQKDDAIKTATDDTFLDNDKVVESSLATEKREGTSSKAEIPAEITNYPKTQVKAGKKRARTPSTSTASEDSRPVKRSSFARAAKASVKQYYTPADISDQRVDDDSEDEYEAGGSDDAVEDDGERSVYDEDAMEM